MKRLVKCILVGVMGLSLVLEPATVHAQLMQQRDTLPIAANVLRMAKQSPSGHVLFWSSMNASAITAEYTRQFRSLGWQRVDAGTPSDAYVAVVFQPQSNPFVLNSSEEALVLLIPTHQALPIGITASYYFW